MMRRFLMLVVPAVALKAPLSVGPRKMDVKRLVSRRYMSQEARDVFASRVAILFPGQGSQYVGMGASVCEEIPAAKELFDRASSILGYDLLRVCREGPKEVLDSTEVSQPAIFVSSMAAVEKLTRERQDVVGKITTAAGLSLGEYSALCFAGAFDFDTGVRLTHARGRAMQKASDVEPSGMVSVVGLTEEQALNMCKQVTLETGSPITIANFLSDRNYALSGGAKACAFVAQHARKRFGARMAVKLAVSGAFHTAYMKPAEAALREIIEAANIGAPVVDVVSNVDVKIHRDPAKIKEMLVRQLTSPVQWEATIKAMVDNGLEEAYECGPGQTLSTMLKRSNPEVMVTTVSV